MSTDDIEILVHISAPTTSADDLRFREEALAYSSFAGVCIKATSHSNEQCSVIPESVPPPSSFESRVAETPMRSAIGSLSFATTNDVSSQGNNASSPRAPDCVKGTATPPPPSATFYESFSFLGSFNPDEAMQNMTPPLRNPLEQLESLQERWHSLRSPVLSPAGSAKSALCSQPTSAKRKSEAVIQEGEESSLFLADTQLAISAIESQLVSKKQSVHGRGDPQRKRQRLSMDSDSPGRYPGNDLVSSEHSFAGQENHYSSQSQLRISANPGMRFPAQSQDSSENLPEDTLQDQSRFHNAHHCEPLKTPSSIPSSQSTEYSGPPTFESLSSQLPVSFGVGELSRLGLIPPTFNDSTSAVVVESPIRATPKKPIHAGSAGTVILETPIAIPADRTPEPDLLQKFSSSPASSASAVESATTPEPPGELESPASSTQEPEAIQGQGHSAENGCQPKVSMPVDFSGLPRQVKAPSPKVGFGSFSPWPSQCTPALSGLVSNPNTRNRYQPQFISRTIKREERGYWSIDASAWPLKQQYDFWTNMSDFIRKGRGGWGMWMTRGPEDEPPPTKELGILHVWCWGELVQHTYILLWAMSSSRIIGSAADWYDGCGKRVVKMPVVGVDD